MITDFSITAKSQGVWENVTKDCSSLNDFSMLKNYVCMHGCIPVYRYIILVTACVIYTPAPPRGNFTDLTYMTSNKNWIVSSKYKFYNNYTYSNKQLVTS